MNYNGLIPRLVVLDIYRSIHFYTKLLSFQIEFEGTDSDYAFLSFGDAQLVLEQHNSLTATSDGDLSASDWNVAPLSYPFGRGMNIAIKVKDLNRIVESLCRAHYPIKMRPRETWYRRRNVFIGERQILVMDPDGYLLRFYEALGEKLAEEDGSVAAATAYDFHPSSPDALKTARYSNRL